MGEHSAGAAGGAGAPGSGDPHGRDDQHTTQTDLAPQPEGVAGRARESLDSLLPSDDDLEVGAVVEGPDGEDAVVVAEGEDVALALTAEDLADAGIDGEPADAPMAVAAAYQEGALDTEPTLVGADGLSPVEAAFRGMDVDPDLGDGEIESIGRFLENEYLPAMRDAETRQEFLEGFEGINAQRNSPYDASVSPNDDGTFELNVNNLSTSGLMSHEFGHGLADAHGGEFVGDRGQALDVAYHFHKSGVRVTDGQGRIPWNFSQPSRVRQSIPQNVAVSGDPRTYMLGQGGDGGFSQWRGRVEAELGIVDRFDPDAVSYTEIEGHFRDGVTEGLRPGDAVEIERPDGSTTRGLIAQRVDRRTAGQVDFVFRDGRSMRWTRGGGWSGGTLTGVSKTAALDDQTPNPGDHPLSKVRGFVDDPETGEQRVQNLVRAANLAWYRQARTTERTTADTRTFIHNTYSSANAHETLARGIEAWRATPNSGKTSPDEAVEVLKNHPEFAAALSDVVKPSDAVRNRLEDHPFVDEWNIDL